jgi:cation diffusion facilitator CzcD-associated flavoprotein CzcO
VGKSVAVIGSGCSAAQLVPHVVRDARKVVQFQRSPQRINTRPNSRFSTLQKLYFQHLPFVMRLYRFLLWKRTDSLHLLYTSTSECAVQARAEATQEAVSYTKETAPEIYHDVLIPKFPLGCKRRIFDPGYLESLHSPKIELTSEPIVAFTKTGLKTSKRDLDFDVVVLSTGFKAQEFLSSIKVTGRDNIILSEHWASTRGRSSLTNRHL